MSGWTKQDILDRAKRLAETPGAIAAFNALTGPEALAMAAKGRLLISQQVTIRDAREKNT